LSLGGAGKTPLVERIARLVGEAGYPVSILSRGYRGAFDGEALLVGDGERVLESAAVAGDEPVMLARALPGVVVAVGPRRDAVGRFVEARFGPRVHVLDDGFQHLRLERDLDVVCLDASSARPIPAGRLREWPRAIERADVVLMSDDAIPPPALDPARAFRLTRRVLGVFTRAGESRPAPRRPFLLAGIARPERFEADARSCCPELVGSRFFPDHHPYRPEDLQQARERARSLGADALLTTAKDEVRLPETPEDPEVLVLRIRAEIGDEGRFRETLLARVREGLARGVGRG
jgi:tetraacyldisaccharide 4'-kinase